MSADSLINEPAVRSYSGGPGGRMQEEAGLVQLLSTELAVNVRRPPPGPSRAGPRGEVSRTGHRECSPRAWKLRRSRALQIRIDFRRRPFDIGEANKSAWLRLGVRFEGRLLVRARPG